MPMKSEAIDDGFDAHDVYELTYTRTGLRVIVTGFYIGTKKSAYMEVFFPNVQGFRCLDEGDLIRFWESEQLRSKNCVYQIHDGGWLSESVPGVLSVTGSVGFSHEYLIATGDYCASVLSTVEPRIHVYDDPYPLAK